MLAPLCVLLKTVPCAEGHGWAEGRPAPCHAADHGFDPRSMHTAFVIVGFFFLVQLHMGRIKSFVSPEISQTDDSYGNRATFRRVAFSTEEQVRSSATKGEREGEGWGWKERKRGSCRLCFCRLNQDCTCLLKVSRSRRAT